MAMESSAEHPAAKLAEARLKAHIARHLPDAQVWLFGSRATRKALRRSDFDLAVDLGSRTPAWALFDFEASILEDSEIIYPVDVIDLRSAAPALRANIERDGILWKS
jgi:predicted nucleotidyltransferase